MVLQLDDGVLEERQHVREEEAFVVHIVQLLGGCDQETHGSIDQPHVLWRKGALRAMLSFSSPSFLEVAIRKPTAP